MNKMTLEQAIEHCYEVTNGGCTACAAEHRQLAEWLEKLRVYEKSQMCNMNVSDLINRQDIKYHVQLEAMGNGQYEEVEVAYKNDIDDLPCVDAVKVVRCKNCEYGQYDCTHMYCDYFCHKVYETDYCSNAVRRSNAVKRREP